MAKVASAAAGPCHGPLRIYSGAGSATQTIPVKEGNHMEDTRYVPVRIALALAVALSLCCAHAKTGPMRIPLRWTPTDDSRLPAGATDALSKQTISVDSFVDAREDRASIGKNSEYKDAGLVSTPDDVGAFLAARFREVLQANGVSTVASGAARVIKAEVQKYFVTEGETYLADVVLRVTVADGAGRTLWQGIGEGHANRWGRTFNEENYEEALSNAFLEATKDVMRNREFLAAFR
jgi:hypothetical protein